MNAALFHKIQRYMQEKTWNQTDLAKNSGIHISDISRVFNHKQPLSLKQLDAITETLGLAEGTLYSYYAEECFNINQHLDKRRSVQFFYKCVEYEYEKEVHNMLHTMVEEESNTIQANYLSYIFSVAEKLFTAGNEKKALPLYDLLIENKSNDFSEQLAISYFRRFYIVKMTEQGPLALMHVLEHLAYMPRDVRKEAYLWITAFYYRCEQWEEVLYYAERLEQMAKGDHYGRALMYKSFALARLDGSLEEVLALIGRYAQVNEYFAEIAVGNRFVAFLDFGQLEYADEYLAWLEKRDDMYIGFPRILEAYVHLNRLEDVKRLLDQYQHVIGDMAVSKEPWLKQKMYLDFRYVNALYQCKSNLFPEGLNELLDVAYTANQIGNVERLKQCLLVYWKYRHRANSDQGGKYIQLLNTEV